MNKIFNTKFFLILSFAFIQGFNIINAQTATLESSLSLIDISGTKVPYQNSIPLPTFEKQKKRITINLAGEWKKLRFTANDNYSLAKRDFSGIMNLENEAANKHLPDFDDSLWEIKTLPGVENKLNEATKAPEFYNDGVWYRKKIDINADYKDSFVKLMFYSVNYVCDVWVNGKYAGYHEGGYTPFAFDISSLLNYGSTNTIAIRVDNIAWNSRKDIVPYTIPDWFNYAGVIHDLYLEITKPVSVARANTVTKNINGDVETSVIIYNSGKETSQVTAIMNVYEADINASNIQSEFADDVLSNEVFFSGATQSQISIDKGSSTVWKTNIQIPNPKLWSMKSPNLYVLKVTLKNGDQIIDEYYTQFGVRSVELRDGRFLLNNRIWFLTGAARHEEHPSFGRSVPKDIIFSDLETIKNLNVLYLRTSHYPNHPYTYLISDRLGLAVMEEIPVYWFDTADAWKIQNEQRKIHLQMFREMVFKDYNRPSVVMWSASNECLEVPNRKIFHQMVSDDIKNNYFDGRILTQSAAADRPGPSDDSQNPLDVAGWTMYFGIFHKYNAIQPKLTEAFGGTFSFLNNAKTAFPNKPIIATEFGYWSSENNSSESDQTYIFNETFRAFKFHAPYNDAGQPQSLGNLFGITWWCVFDWYQYKTNGWQTMGLISMDRKTIKPVATALKSAYLPYFSKEGILVGVDEEDKPLPSQFSLEQNYPNPFNPETVISYTLAEPSHVSLKVYDVLGKEVMVLVDEFKKPGFYNSQFTIHNSHDDKNNSQLSSGVYFYRLQAGQFSSVKKMILMK